jgi:hypothetical protein
MNALQIATECLLGLRQNRGLVILGNATVRAGESDQAVSRFEVELPNLQSVMARFESPGIASQLSVISVKPSILNPRSGNLGMGRTLEYGQN